MKNLLFIFIFLFSFNLFSKLQKELSYKMKSQYFKQKKDYSMFQAHSLNLLLEKDFNDIELNTRIDLLKFFSKDNVKKSYHGSYDIRFRELYTRFQLNRNSYLLLGRFDLDLSDETILSSNSYHQDSLMDWNYYYEGLYYEYDFKNWSIDSILGLQRGSYVMGGLLSYNHSYFDDLSFHLMRTGQCPFYYESEDAMVPFKELFKSECSYYLNRYGLSVSKNHKDLSMRASLSLHDTEYLMEAELNYKKDHYTLSLLYHRDSAQYRPFSYEVHYNAGISDLFYWGNLTYYGASLSAQWKNRLTMNVAVLKFQKTDSKAPVYWSQNPFERSIGKENHLIAAFSELDHVKDLNMEYDFILIYRFSSKLQLSSELSYIQFDPSLKKDSLLRMSLDLNYDF